MERATRKLPRSHGRLSENVREPDDLSAYWTVNAPDIVVASVNG